jgi:hypothetical protein
MKVRLQRSLTEVQVIEADTVVIEDFAGTPVAIAIQHNSHTILASTAGQNDFQQLLDLAGVRRTIYVTQPEPKKISSVRFD